MQSLTTQHGVIEAVQLLREMQSVYPLYHMTNRSSPIPFDIILPHRNAIIMYDQYHHTDFLTHTMSCIASGQDEVV